MYEQWQETLSKDEALADIYEKYRENNTQAYKDIEAFLEQHPEHRFALVLKALFILEWRTGSQYEFVANRLQDNSLQEHPELLRKLFELADTRSQELLESGNAALKQLELGKAIADYERAVLLARDKIEMALCCGLALESWTIGSSPVSRLGLGNRVSPEREIELLQQASDKHLLFVLIESKADSEPYRIAASSLVRHSLKFKSYSQKQLQAFLSLKPQNEAEIELAEKIHQALLEQGLNTLTTLIKRQEISAAKKLLRSLQRAGANRQQLFQLEAEIARHHDASEQALYAYQQALKSRRIEPNLSYSLRLLKSLERLKVKCLSCGKAVVVRPTCPSCNHVYPSQPLLAERYPLDNASLIARIGLAELYEADGNNEKASQEVQKVLNALSAAHDALIPLKVFLNRLGIQRQKQSEMERLFSHIRKQGIDAAARYWLEQLKTQKQLIAQIGTQQRIWLLRRLLEARELALSLEWMSLFFAADSNLASVQILRKELAHALEVYRQQSISEAQTALDAGQTEICLELSSKALVLLGTDAHLRFLRGKAHSLLDYDAAALDDFQIALQNSQDAELNLAIKEAIATLLEERWDLMGALNLLKDIPQNHPRFAKMQARIAHRQNASAAFLVQKSSHVLLQDRLCLCEEDGYEIFFAVQIAEVSRPSSYNQDWQQRLLVAGFEFTQILGAYRDTALDLCFGLRFIAHPVPKNPSQGRIKLAFLVRLSARDEAILHTQAAQVFQDLMASLPLSQEGIYNFEPVVDEDVLKSLISPFEPAHIAEIVRRETNPSVDGIYTISPFVPGTLDMHNLLWTLLRQPKPSMLSIQLKPCHLYSWDKQIMPTQFENEAVGELIDPDGNYIEYLERGQSYVQRRVHHRNRLRDLRYAFILRVQVLGAVGTSQLLPQMAAAAFMGPLRDKDDNGGYEIMQAITEADWQMAQCNIQHLDVVHWGFSHVPAQQVKLRYAVGEHEAAQMFRFPIPNMEGVPGMKLMEGRAVPAPSGMSKQGTVLGISTARAANALPIPITIADEDRARHLYVVGKTGTGKSTLLANVILQDIHDGKAVCLLDPHGDLTEDILLRIPDYRRDDVILFDPSDEEFPIGLNVLNPKNVGDKAKIVNNFLALLMRLYDPHNQGFTGPIFQSMVRNTLLAVMDTKGSSLADAYRILTNVEHIKPFLPNITDAVVKTFWEEEIKRAGNSSSNWRNDLIPYLTSKFSRFVEDPALRRILSQSEYRIDWFEAIQRRKIILLNLAKGRIGTETSQFLGLLLLSQILEAVFQRGQLPPRERHSFSIVIDEVQNYSSPLLGTIISEGRKFGVNLTLANQFLHQLDNGLKEAVFGNIGTLAAMRVGIDDAILLAREFYPIFTADDLTNLPRFTVAMKLLVNGMAARPFTLRTLLPTQLPDAASAAYIRQQSQERYGTAIALVEQEFAKRFGR